MSCALIGMPSELMGKTVAGSPAAFTGIVKRVSVTASRKGSELSRGGAVSGCAGDEQEVEVVEPLHERHVRAEREFASARVVDRLEGAAPVHHRVGVLLNQWAVPDVAVVSRRTRPSARRRGRPACPSGRSPRSRRSSHPGLLKIFDRPRRPTFCTASVASLIQFVRMPIRMSVDRLRGNLRAAARVRVVGVEAGDDPVDGDAVLGAPASGPAVSNDADIGIAPRRLTGAVCRLQPGTSRRSDAGIRIEPPVSEPIAIATMPDATAAPEPPDEPPGICVVSHGLRTGRSGRAGVVAPNASSCMVRLADDDRAGCSQLLDDGRVLCGDRGRDMRRSSRSYGTPATS